MTTQIDGRLHIDPNSWHFQLYKRWYQKNARRWPPKSSPYGRCNYAWIVFRELISVPLRWFFTTPLTRVGASEIRLWMVAIAVLALERLFSDDPVRAVGLGLILVGTIVIQASGRDRSGQLDPISYVGLWLFLVGATLSISGPIDMLSLQGETIAIASAGDFINLVCFFILATLVMIGLFIIVVFGGVWILVTLSESRLATGFASFGHIVAVSIKAFKDKACPPIVLPPIEDDYSTTDPSR